MIEADEAAGRQRVRLPAPELRYTDAIPRRTAPWRRSPQRVRWEASRSAQTTPTVAQTNREEAENR